MDMVVTRRAVLVGMARVGAAVGRVVIVRVAVLVLMAVSVGMTVDEVPVAVEVLVPVLVGVDVIVAVGLSAHGELLERWRVRYPKARGYHHRPEGSFPSPQASTHPSTAKPPSRKRTISRAMG